MRTCGTLISEILSVLALTVGSQAWASPMVLFGVDNLGGGFFQYDLTIDNSGGSEPLSGLLILNGGSVFGLDATSVVGAPQDIGGNPAANWSFIAPFPPFVNILSYFSLDPAADVPVNGLLGGFFFQSTVNPDELSNNDFAVVGVGANSASEIPLGNAQFVPEPSSLFLVACGLAGMAALLAARRRRRQANEGEGLP
jgi:PEP-CTERM motif